MVSLPATGATPQNPAVCLESVYKTYRSFQGEVPALAEVNLTINSGEFVSFVGPSGCGKTTLMMCISGLMQHTGGRITVRNQPVTGPYTGVGMVFQRDVLLEWRTVLSNVLFPAQIAGTLTPAVRERAHALLDQVGLAGFEDRYPAQLSGGMRQRVSICRALLLDPPLLLMDEPFGALDALTREQMNADLLRLFEGTKKTVILITHSIGEAVFLSDRVCIMSPRPGRILTELNIARSLPRPRRAEVQETATFTELVREIKATFRTHGVLLPDQSKGGS